MISNYTNEMPVLLYQKEESNLKVYENNVYDTLVHAGTVWTSLANSMKHLSLIMILKLVSLTNP